ncbi:hypothetical protein V8D89_006581 [Ganoderma adspersum]
MSSTSILRRIAGSLDHDHLPLPAIMIPSSSFDLRTVRTSLNAVLLPPIQQVLQASSQGLGSMLVAPSPTLPPRVQSLEHGLTIPDRTALVARRHSTLSPLHTSRPLRSSPLAGPSIDVPQDDTFNLGALSAPTTPRGGTRHLLPLAAAPAVADPGGEDDVAAKQLRRRTLSAVLSKMSFPSSASSTTSTSTSSATSGSSISSVPDQPAGKPRQRLRSLGAEDTPPVPPMPVWAHDAMPNRRSQNLSSSPSSSPSPSPSPSSARSPVLLRPVSVSVPNSPLSSRENLPTPSPRPRPRPAHANAHARRSVMQAQGQGQGQGHADARASTRLSIAGRLPPSTSRNPEENWLSQAAIPKFSRAGLKAQGVVMPVSARATRRMSTISPTPASAAGRAKSLEGAPSPPAPAHVAPSVSHGRVPRRPATAPSLALLPAPLVLAELRSRTSSLASSQSRASASVSEYFGDRSVSGEGEGEGEVGGEGCETPPLTTSSTATSASSFSVSFADPPVSLIGLGADEFGVVSPSPAGGVQIQVNDVPVPPEAFYNAPYDVNGQRGGNGKWKGKERAVAVDVRPVGSAGSISSMASQTSFGAYSARSGSAARRSESPGGAEALSFSTRHVRAATAPAEVKARAHEGLAVDEKENLKRRRSTIARVWKQVVRSVGHR